MSNLITMESVVRKYEGYELASPKSSKEILDFYKSIPMKATSLNIFFDRSPDFYSLLNYQGDKNFVIICRNKYKKIIGVASVVVRDGYYKGEVERVAYFSDLRLHSTPENRYLLNLWKQLFVDIISNSNKIIGLECTRMICAILADNKKAIKSLVASSKNNFYFNSLGATHMVSLLKSFTTDNSGLNVERATEGCKNELLTFIDNKFKTYNYGYTRKFISDALTSWKDLAIENFILVKDKSGKIIACSALWKPSSAKKTIVTRLSWPLKLLKVVLSFFKPLPSEGEELKIAYLSFMVKDENKGNLLKPILTFLRKSGEFRNYHIISFQTNKVEENSNLKCITTKTKINLYEISAVKNSATKESQGFEIALT